VPLCLIGTRFGSTARLHWFADWVRISEIVLIEADGHLILPHPAYSSDFAPVEDLFRGLKGRLQDIGPTLSVVASLHHAPSGTADLRISFADAVQFAVDTVTVVCRLPS
jgi:hypothetical protein